MNRDTFDAIVVPCNRGITVVLGYECRQECEGNLTPRNPIPVKGGFMEMERKEKKVGKTKDRSRSEHLSGLLSHLAAGNLASQNAEQPANPEPRLPALKGVDAAVNALPEVRHDAHGIPNIGALLEKSTTQFSGVLRAICKVGKELGLSDDERRQALTSMIPIAKRRLPQFAIVLFVESVLPLVQERAYLHFRYDKRESVDDAMELSQALVEKLLKSFVGRWPRGNVGAWITAIRSNVYADHVKQRAREKQKLEKYTGRTMRR
jgi:hypothetical protein